MLTLAGLKVRWAMLWFGALGYCLLRFGMVRSGEVGKVGMDHLAVRLIACFILLLLIAFVVMRETQ